MRLLPLLALSTFILPSLHAQELTGALPMSMRLGLDVHAIPTVQAAPFDATAAAMDDAQRDATNKLQLYARFVDAPATLSSAGEWTELEGGDRVWRLRVVSPGAHALELFFLDTYFPPGAQLHVYDEAQEQVIGGFSQIHVQPNGSFVSEMIFGETCIVEYHEPAAVRGEGSLRLDKAAHAYRMIAGLKSGACEVDVACSEGTNWTNQRDAVVRIRVTIPSGTGICTGTLMNNTALDCKQYILTAFHCTEESVDANYASFQFRFRYQRPVCDSGTATGNNLLGCIRRADSNDGGGNTGSDFALLEMTSPIPASFEPYWAGWDITTSAPVGGVGIHHPDGDVKKISTFTGTAGNASWGGIASSSHWRLTWTATANGHGVTEPGSSGSPIFNSAKRVVGTLTGGGSCCTVNGCGSGTGPTVQDLYGKMSFHFGTNNPNPTNEELDNWLSPGSTVTFLEGSENPCGPIGIDESIAPAPEVFPNPANDRITVRLPDALLSAERLMVTDVAGRVVHELMMNGAPSVELDTRAWGSGAFLITVVGDGLLPTSSRVTVVR